MRRLPGRLRSPLCELWTLDLRSLALFRVGLGVTLLLDLVVRSQHLRAHYSDAGIWPRAAWLANQRGPLDWSFHLATGGELGIALMMGAAALCALSLALGYWTRLATALSWLLLFSLQQRNPHVLNGGDALLRILLFWALFLPLGQRLSLDRLQSGRGSAATTVRSAAAFALLAQIGLVYGFAAIWKDHPMWHGDANAVYYALSIDQFATAASGWLLARPELLRLLTIGVWWLEALGPALLFLPGFTGVARALAVALFLGLHAGFAIFMELGLFPLICGVAWLAVTPSVVWDSLGRRRRGRGAGPAAAPAQLDALRFRSGPALRSLAITSLLGIAVAWNLGTRLPALHSLPGAFIATDLGILLGLDQRWSMFAPYPLLRDGWFVAAGETGGGQRRDLLRSGAPLSWTKPERVSALYPTQRWRKYMMNLIDAENREQRAPFARFLCREWNASAKPADRIEAIRLVFMVEDSRPGRRVAAVRPWTLFDGPCERPPATRADVPARLEGRGEIS